ncbi:MAG TPA: DUF6777 domain-containing protein [Iamia sp.]
MSGWPPPPAAPGYGYGPPPAPRPARGNGGIIAAFVIAVVLLLLGAAVVVTAIVLAADDDDDEASEEVFLEPIATARDPFTEPVGTDASVSSVGAAAGQAVASRTGGEPGLYGGTQREGDCDTAQLATFLANDRAKADAWAGVVGIPVGDVPSYIDRLTPVVLRSDTRITNHGFSNGRATAIQAVLQAGTAVLVDDRGRPVTKCYCGNPLGPPAPSAQRYRGSRWDGFDEGALTVVVDNDVVIETFVLIDVVTGETFSRPAGTGGDEDGPAPPDTTTTTTTTAPATTAPATTSPPATTEGPSPLDGTFALHAEVAEGSDGSCVAYDATFTVAVVGSGSERTVRFDAGAGNAFEGPLGEDGSFDLSAPLSNGQGTQTLTGRLVEGGGTVTVSGTATVDSGGLRCNLTFSGERTA